MAKNLSHIGEFGLINEIRKTFSHSRSVIQGIGDDAAALDVEGGGYLLLTTDMLVENEHFTYQDKPGAIGHKAMACSISDIAAMGGIPRHAVVSLGAPAKTNYSFIRGLMGGLKKTARHFGVDIVGGDTVKAPKIVINVSLTGHVKRSHLVTRGGARRGDIIFVTGPLGRSFKNGKHLSFTPRLKAAQFLACHFKPKAMIDISDGLIADLGHILKESRRGAEIDATQIPKNPGATLDEALYDGEDFELLFTLSPAKAVRLKRLRHKNFSFYEIGRITSASDNVTLIDNRGRASKLKVKGFEHF